MKSLQICLYLICVCSLSYAQTKTRPDIFLRNLYTQEHLPWTEGTNVHKIDFTNKKSLSRFFADTIVNLIIKDNEYSKKSGDVGCLDGDPIYDAQEGEPVTTNITVKKVNTQGNKFLVSFHNLITKTFIYTLTHTSHGWRIIDIEYPSHTTLLGILNCAKE